MATSPTGTAGAVDITVATSGFTSATSAADQFSYLPPPAVTGLSPTAGPTNGEISVTITGTSFVAGATVDFGPNAATSVVVVSSEEITATAPAGTGTVDVTVTDVGGVSASSSADQFTYQTPSVEGVSSTQAAGVYTTGATISITVDFSEAVQVTGTPQLALNAGGGATANYVSGSGTAALTFSYTVAAGQGTTDLDYASTAALVLNGGTIEDLAGAAAGLTLATPGSGSDALAAKNIAIQTVTADQANIGPVNSTAAGFTIYGGTPGEAFSYTVKSSGNPAVMVSGSGTVTSNTYDVTGINVSSTLPTGTLTYTVTMAGSPSTPLTATASFGVDPSGYSVTFDQPTYNLTTGQNAGFTIHSDDADLGDQYFYTIGNSTFVEGSGTVTSTTQDIQDIDVTSVAGGTISLDIVLKDTGGNLGLLVTTSATLDKTVPKGYTITPDEPRFGPAAATDTGFTFTGATTDTTYLATVTSSGGAGQVTMSGSVTSATQDVTGIDVSSLPGGTLTYSVTLTNTVGNTGTAATATAVFDKTAPSGFTITPDQSLITASQESSTGFTIAGGEIGDTYSYTITGGGGGAEPIVINGGSVTGSGTLTAATQDITGIDLTSLGDGTVTYSVTLTNLAGTSGPITATATIDSKLPTGLALSTSVAPSGQSGAEVGVLQTVGRSSPAASIPTRSSPSTAAPTALHSRSRSAATT